jgi:SAM-dependent methyltransferase
MWEYPFALLAADLKEGMRCLDVGCGMTAFTIYLKEVTKCDVVGIDPDVFDVGVRYKGYGVSREFVRRAGIKVVQCNMASIAFKSNTFDRVFCLSVIEHLEAEVARRGVQEMARIVKPQGRLIITVDVNMLSEVSHPLDLIWESGLQPLGAIDLRWPRRRLGIFCDRKQPADVFGMTLLKDDYEVETEYSDKGMKVDVVPACHVPSLRAHPPRVPPSQRPLWRQIVGRAMGYLWRSVRQRLHLVW